MESNIDYSNKKREIEKEDRKGKENFSSAVTEKESTTSPRRVKGGSVSYHRQGHGQGHGHSSSSHSIMGPPTGFDFDKLSQEMKVFVASDTLNSLLVASSSNITAETLVLVISILFTYISVSQQWANFQINFQLIRSSLKFDHFTSLLYDVTNSLT